MPTLLVLRKSVPPKFHRSIWILHGLSFHQSLEACFAYCVGRILQFTCHKIAKLRLSFCKWFVWDVVGGQLPPFSCAYIKGLETRIVPFGGTCHHPPSQSWDGDSPPYQGRSSVFWISDSNFLELKFDEWWIISISLFFQKRLPQRPASERSMLLSKASRMWRQKWMQAEAGPPKIACIAQWHSFFVTAWLAGATAMHTKTRRPPNCFHFRRQVMILQRYGSGGVDAQFQDWNWGLIS